MFGCAAACECMIGMRAPRSTTGGRMASATEAADSAIATKARESSKTLITGQCWSQHCTRNHTHCPPPRAPCIHELAVFLSAWTRMHHAHVCPFTPYSHTRSSQTTIRCTHHELCGAYLPTVISLKQHSCCSFHIGIHLALSNKQGHESHPAMLMVLRNVSDHVKLW